MLYKKNEWGQIELTKRFCLMVMMIVVMMETLPNWLLPMCSCLCCYQMRQRICTVPQGVPTCTVHCQAVVIGNKRPNNYGIMELNQYSLSHHSHSLAFLPTWHSAGFDIIGGSELEFVKQTAVLWLGNLFYGYLILYSLYFLETKFKKIISN